MAMLSMDEFKSYLPKNGEIADEQVFARSQVKLQEEILELNVVAEQITPKKIIVPRIPPNVPPLSPSSSLEISSQTHCWALTRPNTVTRIVIRQYTLLLNRKYKFIF